jgi:hypothetical protein
MLAVLHQEERHIEMASFTQNNCFLGSLKSFHFSFFIWFFGPGAFVSGFFYLKKTGILHGYSIARRRLYPCLLLFKTSREPLCLNPAGHLPDPGHPRLKACPSSLFFRRCNLARQAIL